MLDFLFFKSLPWVHRGWARRKMFKIEVLGRLENAILKLVFASFQLLYKNYVAFNSLKTT